MSGDSRCEGRGAYQLPAWRFGSFAATPELETDSPPMVPPAWERASLAWAWSCLFSPWTCTVSDRAPVAQRVGEMSIPYQRCCQ